MALGLARTSLLTKNLEISEYGQIGIVFSFFSFLTMFFSIRSGDLIYRLLPQTDGVSGSTPAAGVVAIAVWCDAIVNIGCALFVLVAASWISGSLYHNGGLRHYFQIWALSLPLLIFNTTSVTILRLNGRFASVLSGQFAGRLVMVGSIFLIFMLGTGLSIRLVLYCELAGIAVSTGIIFIASFPFLKPFLSQFLKKQTYLDLKPRVREIAATLFHTNLGTYLRIVSAPGDVFLLGIFSTPREVGLYTFSYAVATIFSSLQSNLQTVITPEIIKLWHNKEFDRIKSLLRRIMVPSIIGGIIITAISIPLVRPLIVWFASSEYLAAAPIITMLMILQLATIAITPVIPVALSIDAYKTYNYSNIINVALMATFLFSPIPKNALTMGTFQLIAGFIYRIMANVVILRKFDRIALKVV